VLERFKKHIQKKFSYLQHESILIALSGGLDSVVLTHLMRKMNPDCTLAHCNFNLRGKESDLDEAFAKELGNQLGLEVETTSFATQKKATEEKISIQMAARELRYQWFDQIAKRRKIKHILTAHHKDDVLETFLINLTRGTGLEGLTGIPEKNGAIIRPLLPFSKEELQKYAEENAITWREDQSNASSKYARNKIRHQIIPVLKELNPNLLNSFDQTIEHLQESRLLAQDRIAAFKKELFIDGTAGEIYIPIEKLNALKHPKAYLYALLKPYGFNDSAEILSLLKAQSGKLLYSKTHRIVKDRERFILTALKDRTTPDVLIQKTTNYIVAPVHLKIDTVPKVSTYHSSVAFLDKSKLKFPLTVRKWKKGDYFYPIGLQGKKKLSKFFKDEKYSLFEKENTWILCSGDDIAWIVGKRLDERYKITNETTSILKIEHSNA
jgi:tRNA(Ile)-lysidine synthase